MLKRLLWWYDSQAAWERSRRPPRGAGLGMGVRIGVTAVLLAFLAVGVWEYVNQDDFRVDPYGGRVVTKGDGK